MTPAQIDSYCDCVANRLADVIDDKTMAMPPPDSARPHTEADEIARYCAQGPGMPGRPAAANVR